MKKNNLDDLDLDDLALGLFRLGLQLVREERGIAGGKGTLRIPKLSALAAVADASSIQVERLARCEGVRESTMSSTVEMLAEANLVEILEDPDDKRSKRVHTTLFGARRLKREKKRLTMLLLEAEVDGARGAKVREAVETLLSLVSDYRKRQEQLRQARRRRRIPQRTKG